MKKERVSQERNYHDLWKKANIKLFNFLFTVFLLTNLYIQKFEINNNNKRNAKKSCRPVFRLF